MLGLGYALAGLLNPTDFWSVTLLIGVVGGSGIGLAYVVPIAVGTAWFPDKKGLIMGLAVAGFGFGAMFWVKLAGAWGHLLDSIGLGDGPKIYPIPPKTATRTRTRILSIFFLFLTSKTNWSINPSPRDQRVILKIKTPGEVSLTARPRSSSRCS